MTNHSGIFIPRDLIREEFYDVPEYRDTDAPTGAAAGFLVMGVMGGLMGMLLGWFIWAK